MKWVNDGWRVEARRGRDCGRGTVKHIIREVGVTDAHARAHIDGYIIFNKRYDKKNTTYIMIRMGLFDR